ncbi:MAG: hypothetical protein OEZ43_16665 [Gammaproteobacteria bacterium]|nr:hypothetical protein [Gammaproteobacteria bacterium]
MKKRTIVSALVLSALSVSMNNSFAADTKVSGFLRAAGAISTGETPYLERIDRNGNAGDTHFGLNVSRDVTDNLQVAGQLWASGAEGGTFEMMLDWAYASLRVAEGLSVNGGKIKYPNLIVSEYIDVGITYPWARPPQELYGFDVEGRPNMSLESFVGASMVYEGFAGDMEYTLQAYGGEAGLEGEAGVSGGTLSKMLGAKFKFGTDVLNVHAAYNRHMPEGTIGELGAPAMKNGHTVTVLSAGAMMNWQNILLMGEYATASVADEVDENTTGLYGTVGYRIGSFMPHFTYAQLDAEEGRSSMTLGVKYQMSPVSTFKVDWAQITPDAEPGEEAESFGVATVALDVVF